MSDGDGGACAFGAAPSVGAEAQVLSDQFCVYKLSPQEARDPLSNLPQSASIELERINEGGHEMATTVDPRNPGILRFVRDEDAHPEGPRQTGMAP
jgi:hypothetical protein